MHKLFLFMKEGDLIGMAIVGGFAVKLPRPSQENVTSFHRNDITYHSIFIFPNGELDVHLMLNFDISIFIKSMKL